VNLKGFGEGNHDLFGVIFLHSPIEAEENHGGPVRIVDTPGEMVTVRIHEASPLVSIWSVCFINRYKNCLIPLW
jgi:hypothetical protein